MVSLFFMPLNLIKPFRPFFSSYIRYDNGTKKEKGVTAYQC